ncbi:hypothetical protein GOP47_0013724 [Adiantum capillus-veneris]|uniref:EF-hand domain-containing protein n=1 Tax=Adiantum capillus-veneris TaxID=13818 RepID=A0A9D4UP26_ADICA|nr:hypothetical protein GOP47_0013724 [Adiantum capillus-veneris]
MPLKICPRLEKILNPRSSQAFKGAYLYAGNADCEGEGVAVANTHFPETRLHQLQNKIHDYTEWTRKRVFFMYERRIRAYSSPEKVFEYFASIKESKGKFYMSPGDLMRAIIPVVPPSESTTIRGGYLVGERNPGDLHCAPSRLFSMFDTDSDGKISFEEYNFIRTLIITSLESFVATFKMFDRNGDGLIDFPEFQKVMHLMREKNKEKIVQSGSLLPSRRSLDSSENNSLLKYLFGSDGKRVLQYKEFIQFLEELHDEILRLEFSHYDCKQQGHIPAQDFASSMVAAASMSNISKYLRRVDAVAKEPAFKDVHISFKDFEEFSKLRKQRKLLVLSAYAVDGSHGFSKQDFQWAASQVCQVELSDTAVDVIFFIFDSNDDGKLSLTEFLGVQDLREISGVDPLQPGVLRMLRCMWKCARENCDPKLHG